jgi:hypothetical protein
MANTWHFAQQSVAYAVNRDMGNVFNGAASARVIRVYRMWLLNNQIVSVAGQMNFIEVWRNTAAAGGTPVTPVAHDPSDSALDGNTTAGYGQTVTNGAQLRRLLSQNDEPTVSTLDMDSLLTLLPYAEIWNSGYADTNIKPLTCPIGSSIGYGIKSVTTAVGTADVEIEFTDSAS